MLICWLQRSVSAIWVDEKKSPWNIPWLISKLLNLILAASCLRFKIVFHFCILTFRELIKVGKLFSYTIMQDQKDIFYSQFIHCWHSYYSEQQFPVTSCWSATDLFSYKKLCSSLFFRDSVLVSRNSYILSLWVLYIIDHIIDR